jgi:hypothetical protein
MKHMAPWWTVPLRPTLKSPPKRRIEDSGLSFEKSILLDHAILAFLVWSQGGKLEI